MKNLRKIGVLSIFVIIIMFLTGCGNEQVTYRGRDVINNKYVVTFEVKDVDGFEEVVGFEYKMEFNKKIENVRKTEHYIREDISNTDGESGMEYDLNVDEKQMIIKAKKVTDPMVFTRLGIAQYDVKSLDFSEIASKLDDMYQRAK